MFAEGQKEDGGTLEEITYLEKKKVSFGLSFRRETLAEQNYTRSHRGFSFNECERKSTRKETQVKKINR